MGKNRKNSTNDKDKNMSKGMEGSANGNNKNENIVSLVFSLVAVLISAIGLVYSVSHDKNIENMESYFQQLNYHVDFLNEGYTAEIVSKNEEKTVEINTPDFVIVPETGGIKRVSLIFYYDNECYAVLPLSMMEDIDHKKYKASDIMSVIKEFSHYAYTKDVSSKSFKDEGYDASYYTTIFVCVEDFMKNTDITPIVFEYPINGDGNLVGKYDARQYNEVQLVYIYNQTYSPLPIYDMQMLNDYRTLLEKMRS